MINRLGVYDLFAYMFPGAIYLSATIISLFLWSSEMTMSSSKLDASTLVLLIAASYLIGMLMSTVKWTPWDIFFPYPDLTKEVKDLQQTYPEVIINIGQNQWPVLQAFSALENLDLSLAVDKLRATHIMLRGVSQALCVLVAIPMIYVVNHSESIISCFAGAILALCGSALAAKGSRMFLRWTFRYTVELMIARAIDPTNFVKRKIKHDSADA